MILLVHSMIPKSSCNYLAASGRLFREANRGYNLLEETYSILSRHVPLPNNTYSLSLTKGDSLPILLQHCEHPKCCTIPLFIQFSVVA